MTLTAEHLQYIKHSVENSAISRTVMQENIVDHLCCAIESRMQQGILFEEAFVLSLKELAPNGLQEIERETYLLLNFKSILMKKFLYSLALLSSIAASFGVIFKILHITGADEFVLFGILGISFTIPIIKFKPSLSSFENARYWFLMISAVVLTFGLLLKMLHLAGANLTLLFGGILFSFGFLPMFFIKMYRESVAS